jgi:hypothetical protein
MPNINKKLVQALKRNWGHRMIWKEEYLYSLGQDGDILAKAATEQEAKHIARLIAEIDRGVILDTGPSIDGWYVATLDMTDKEERMWTEHRVLPHWVWDDIIYCL